MIPQRLSAPIFVLGGGLIGSGARALVARAWPVEIGQFPFATFLVNVLGAFALGLFLARQSGSSGSARSMQFWAIGLLGSFTTFSAFGVEVVQLIDAGNPSLAAGYVFASTGVGLLAAVAGGRAGSMAR